MNSERTGRVQMSDIYWAYVREADNLRNPPDWLCRENATQMEIEGFFRKTKDGMRELLKLMPPSERPAARDYLNIRTFTPEAFLEICNKRSKGNLPGDLIEVGSKMVAGEPVTI